MEAAPITAPEPRSVCRVFRVPELLPPLIAITKARVLLGSRSSGSGTGVLGIRGVLMPLSGVGLPMEVGSTVPPDGPGVIVSPGTGVST